MDISQAISKNYNSLTKSELKLANYILNHTDEVIYDSLKSLGEKANTGDATIIRLCKKIGLNGFSDLKINLAQETMLESPNLKSNVSFLDSSAESLITTIKKTKNLTDKDKILKTINYLSNANNIYLFGVGHSAESARDFEKTWLRIGLISQAVTDPHIQIQVSTLLNDKDLVFGLSLSGHTKDTYDSLKLAKKSGAKIIVITNNLFSPIAKLADIILQTAVSEFSSIGSVVGQISQLYLCDVIARAYEEQIDIDSNAIKEKALKVLVKKSI